MQAILVSTHINKHTAVAVHDVSRGNGSTVYLYRCMDHCLIAVQADRYVKTQHKLRMFWYIRRLAVLGSGFRHVGV